MRRIPRAPTLTCIALASALCVTAPAFAAADYYLKFDGVDGETKASSDKPRIAVIEVQSWSWGASQTATSGVGGGMGAGKVNVQDISVMRGPRQTAATDGVKVAAGDVDGDGRADAAVAGVKAPRDSATGLATGKRMHKPRMVPTMELGRSAPPSREAGSLTTLVPAGMCRTGATYPSAELGTPGGVYRLEGVSIVSCAPAASSGGDRPMESLSLNYTKIQW